MMKETALAQAATLREWSDLWAREVAAGREGASEAMFLMKRTALLIERMFGSTEADQEKLPEPTVVDEVRAG